MTFDIFESKSSIEKLRLLIICDSVALGSEEVG